MDLKLLNHAKDYIEKMANGIDPLTNETIPANELLNNVKISRCLFYVNEVLEKVIQKESKYRGKKVPFYIEKEKLQNFEYSEKRVSLSEVVSQINMFITREDMYKLTVKNVQDWLVSVGALEEEIPNNNQKRKSPTSLGESLGITSELRTSSLGIHYKINIYNIEAQKFIIDNFENLLAFMQKNK